MPRYKRANGSIGYGDTLPKGATWDTSNKANSIPGDGQMQSTPAAKPKPAANPGVIAGDKSPTDWKQVTGFLSEIMQETDMQADPKDTEALHQYLDQSGKGKAPTHWEKVAKMMSGMMQKMDLRKVSPAKVAKLNKYLDQTR